MRATTLLLIGLILLGCSKDDPQPAGAALLSFPEQNSECTTGVDLTETTSEVEFRWQSASNTETYELRVTQLLTNITQTTTTSDLSARLPLDKGAPYSWNVVTRNSATQDGVPSTTWLFYNAGSETSYAPFPAQIIRPLSGITVVADGNGEITLEWVGADVEGDIMEFEVFLSVQSPPEDLAGTPGPSQNTLSVPVDSDTVYYWRVVTKDSEGNSSDSGIFSFRVL